MLAAIDFNSLENQIGGSGTNKFAGKTLGDLISELLPWIFAIAGLILLLYLVFAGFQLLVSQGEPKAVAGARGRITNALIGFVIIFVSYWLVQIIAKVLGLTAVSGIF